MTESVSRRPKVILALGAAVIAMCMGLVAASPPESQAFTTTVYCEGRVLGGEQSCWGAERSMYAVFGWGDQHSVCVGWSVVTGPCSGGPGQGVYDAFGTTHYAAPRISNNAPGTNTVHGRAYTE